MPLVGVQFSVTGSVVLSQWTKQMGPEKSVFVSYGFFYLLIIYIPLKELVVECLGNLDAERASSLIKKALPQYTNEPKE